ncbi:MAG: hypothetical protein GPJ10_09185 [Microcystis aeruginosa L211-07]|jgi:hypothetical protein|nr:hypothetical protein [Microcystis aeruginosa L211-07]
MLEQIILSIISGLIIPIMLELWKDYQNKKAEARQKSRDATNISMPSPKPSSRGSRTFFVVVAKLLTTLLIAFFGSAIVAAILENTGHPTIEFGSALANFLMFALGLITWLILFRK